MAVRKTGKQYIKIRGANENNLKNLDVDIPRDEFVVLTNRTWRVSRDFHRQFLLIRSLQTETLVLRWER